MSGPLQEFARHRGCHTQGRNTIALLLAIAGNHDAGAGAVNITSVSPGRRRSERIIVLFLFFDSDGFSAPSQTSQAGPKVIDHDISPLQRDKKIHCLEHKTFRLILPIRDLVSHRRFSLSPIFRPPSGPRTGSSSPEVGGRCRSFDSVAAVSTLGEIPAVEVRRLAPCPPKIWGRNTANRI
ncbi:hypothetical protein GGTG_03559 [Gaeumannomyces tritici R3-111a-1]|uniref:Uncharacterized protein n=1 Tax=Gaeumannomyces tritici (strain R3-111a-1) TaxID=644352 RepID=J3NQK3_GAET3|nr:hypothetical protein GGTG_03559 [Gaeumannomyces tritici R3-111a-1]EJT78459.1 hypothetical protein GGTG_03559 [Gaeumannomyces tritici R3-111a-1]